MYPGLIISDFSPPHLPIASCFFLLLKLMSSSLVTLLDTVTPMTVPLSDSGRQNSNYMSKMSVLPLSSRSRTQTHPPEVWRPTVDAAALGPSCSGRGVSTVPLLTPGGDWVFPLTLVCLHVDLTPTSRSTPSLFSFPSLTPESMWKCLSLTVWTHSVASSDHYGVVLWN